MRDGVVDAQRRVQRGPAAARVLSFEAVAHSIVIGGTVVSAIVVGPTVAPFVVATATGVPPVDPRPPRPPSFVPWSSGGAGAGSGTDGTRATGAATCGVSPTSSDLVRTPSGSGPAGRTVQSSMLNAWDSCPDAARSRTPKPTTSRPSNPSSWCTGRPSADRSSTAPTIIVSAVQRSSVIATRLPWSARPSPSTAVMVPQQRRAIGGAARMDVAGQRRVREREPRRARQLAQRRRHGQPPATGLRIDHDPERSLAAAHGSGVVDQRPASSASQPRRPPDSSKPYVIPSPVSWSAEGGSGTAGVKGLRVCAPLAVT